MISSMRRILVSLVLVLVVLLVGLPAYAEDPQPLPDDPVVSEPILEPPPIECTAALVTRVIDGDTIDVLLDGSIYRVRYIGVNTPETVDPRRPVQYYGKQASDYNKSLVSDREVCLEKDISETDRYGRLLRYVWLDGYMVNAELVAQGYAYASAYPPDVKYQDWFRQLQAEAQAAGVGLWAPVEETIAPEPPLPDPTATPQPTATPIRLIAPTPVPVAPSGCCRICTTGKACGNGCININYTCRQPPGCACNR